VTKYGIFARRVMMLRSLQTRHVGRVILTSLVIVVIGVGMWFGVEWYHNRPRIQSSYYGVSLGASKQEVIYVLGYPDFVRENPDNSPWKCCKETTAPSQHLNEPWTVDSILAPLNKLPAGSALDDYDEWNYNPEKGKFAPYITVQFHNGNAETITCDAGAENDYCTDVLGITPGTTEADVKARLGKPESAEISGVTKKMVYYRYRAVFNLTKRKVYMLGISSVQK
jgi:hypothetical protein